VAGVALMALGWLWWCAWVPVDAVDAAALCVAGVALGDMDLHFAWQAWHLWHWAGSGGTAVEHVSICLLKLPLILIAAPETCMCSSGDVHRYGKCSRAARLFFLLRQFIHIRTHTYTCTHSA